MSAQTRLVILLCLISSLISKVFPPTEMLFTQIFLFLHHFFKLQRLLSKYIPLVTNIHATIKVTEIIFFLHSEV